MLVRPIQFHNLITLFFQRVVRSGLQGNFRLSTQIEKHAHKKNLQLPICSTCMSAWFGLATPKSCSTTLRAAVEPGEVNQCAEPTSPRCRAGKLNRQGSTLPPRWCTLVISHHLPIHPVPRQNETPRFSHWRNSVWTAIYGMYRDKEPVNVTARLPQAVPSTMHTRIFC